MAEQQSGTLTHLSLKQNPEEAVDFGYALNNVQFFEGAGRCQEYYAAAMSEGKINAGQGNSGQIYEQYEEMYKQWQRLGKPLSISNGGGWDEFQSYARSKRIST